MGLIHQAVNLLFGGGTNVVKETAEVFRENAEAGAARAAGMREQALAQLASEFAMARKGGFDRFMDGLNRLPRPALALGTLALFGAAMVDPLWFAERMQGIALVPEPLWWLLGVIVSFYFGARHQAKTQDLQRELAATLARAPDVIGNINGLRNISHGSPRAADAGDDADVTIDILRPEANAALEDWRKLRRA
ncbi:holin family protein [Lutimaribacter marinistellae]|uniref:Holin family protein n=1 Tax=Lutimaribacter marinistellae TaxID=1820329 RepID=A0ABV7TLB2_9RHOB